MRRVRSRDTKPEVLVRKLLTERGIRYRLHRRDLPGRPDIFISRLRLAVFVNGCFWHGHSCAKGRKRPVTNATFWENKLTLNVRRDIDVRNELRKNAISVLDLWTCEASSFGAHCDMVARSYRGKGQGP